MRLAVTGEAHLHRALRHVERVRALKRHATIYAVGATSITAVWAVTQYQASSWSIWVAWPLLVWTQILFVHALVTYLRRPVPDGDAEYGEHDR